VTGGVAAHELVECGLAGPVDLEPTAFVVGDTALARGHDGDGAVRVDKLTERLDDPHGTEGVGDHEAGEFLVRDVRRRLVGTVGDTGVDEEEVEPAIVEPVAASGTVGVWTTGAASGETIKLTKFCRRLMRVKKSIAPLSAGGLKNEAIPGALAKKWGNSRPVRPLSRPVWSEERSFSRPRAPGWRRGRQRREKA